MSQRKSLKTLQVNKVSGSTEPLSVRAGEIRCAKYLNADGTPFAPDNGGGGGDVSKGGSISADYVMLVDPQRSDPGVMLQHGDGVQVDGDTLVISSGRVEELVPQPDNMAVWAAPLDDSVTTNVCSNAAVTLTGDGVKITRQGTYFGSDKYGQINLSPSFSLSDAFTIRFRLSNLFMPEHYSGGPFLQVNFPPDSDGDYVNTSVSFNLAIKRRDNDFGIPVDGLVKGTPIALGIGRIDTRGILMPEHVTVLHDVIDAEVCETTEHIFELDVMCPQGDVDSSDSPSACGAQLFIDGTPIFATTSYLGDTMRSYNGKRDDDKIKASVQFMNYYMRTKGGNCIQYIVRDVAIWDKVMHPEWDRSFVPDTFYRAGMYGRDDVGNVIVQSTLNATPSGAGSLVTSGGVYVGKDVVANGHGFFTQDVQSRGVICTDNNGDPQAAIALNDNGDLQVHIARENVCIVPNICLLVASFTNAPIIDMLYDYTNDKYLYNVIPSAASAGIMVSNGIGVSLLNQDTFLQWPLDLGSSSVVLEFQYDPDDESMSKDHESQLISVTSCDDSSSSITIYYGCYGLNNNVNERQIKISLKYDSTSVDLYTGDLVTGSGRYAVVYSVSSDTYFELYQDGKLIQSWSGPVNSSLSMLFSNKCMLQVGSSSAEEVESGDAFVPGFLSRLTIADLSGDYQYDPSSSVVGWEFEDIHSVALPSELNVIPPSSVDGDVPSHGALWVQGGAHIGKDALVSGSVLSGAVSSQTSDLVLSAGKTIWGVLPADASLIATLKTAAVIDWHNGPCSDIPDDMQPTVFGQVTFDGSTMTITNDSEDIDSSVEWNIGSQYNIISSAFTVRFCTTYNSLGGFFLSDVSDEEEGPCKWWIYCNIFYASDDPNSRELELEVVNSNKWLHQGVNLNQLSGDANTQCMIELDYDSDRGYVGVYIDGKSCIRWTDVPNLKLTMDTIFRMGFGLDYDVSSFVVNNLVIWNTCKHYTDFDSSIDSLVNIEEERQPNSVTISYDQTNPTAVTVNGNVAFSGDASLTGNLTSQGIGTFYGISFPQDPSQGNFSPSDLLTSYYCRHKVVTYRGCDMHLLQERIGNHVTITIVQYGYTPDITINTLGAGTIDPQFCPSEFQDAVWSLIFTYDETTDGAVILYATIDCTGAIAFFDDTGEGALPISLDGECFNYGIFDGEYFNNNGWGK